MTIGHQAAYFFCAHLEHDPAAAHIFRDLERLVPDLCATGIVVDGFPVMEYQDAQGNRYLFARTADVLSHDYPRYLPILQQHFSGVDLAGLVNWHEGANAPDKILTVHTTGDVPSGNFGRAHPRYMRNLLLALEAHRQKADLADFRVVTEGTHWSGIPYGGAPALIQCYDVPLVDIEIGSSQASWSNPLAAEVVARSLIEVFQETCSGGPVRSLLCAGGVHLEPAFIEPVLATRDGFPLAVSHILPNQWIVTGDYTDGEGQRKLTACVESIEGEVDAIVYHDNLKGAHKDVLRTLADTLRVPVFKHQALRRPADLPIW